MASEANLTAVSRADNETMARSLADEIAHGIREGRYPQNARLPSERTLAEEHGVPRRAARLCVEILEREGLVYRMERTGAFVRGASPPTLSETTERRIRAITFVEDFWPAPPERQPLIADYLAAYTEALDPTDIRMRFEPHLQRHDRFDQLFSDSLPLQEQACVLVSVAPADLMGWLNERKIPFVVQYYREYDHEGLPPHHGVWVNKFRGAHDAVRFLLDAGHRRIGFLGHPDADNPVYEGYTAAMRCAGGLPSRKDTRRLGTDSTEVAYDPALRYLKENRGITAIFCQTDAVAIAVLRAASDLGLRVPDDLSVVGFNDIAEAEHATPPLTTVASPRRLLAHTAVEMLLKSVAGAYDAWQQKVLDCRLVVRASASGPARPAGTDSACGSEKAGQDVGKERDLPSR